MDGLNCLQSIYKSNEKQEKTMPNWIQNELVAYNLDPRVKTILEATFKQDDPFQTICPMPEILNDTQSPTPYRLREMLGGSSRILAVLDDLSVSSINRKDEWRQKILEIGVDEMVRRIKEDKSIGEHEADEFEFAIRAIATTGYSNWYDWRLDNWGVKWDASEQMLEDEPLFKDESLGNPDLVVTFNTPWGPPTGILQNLTKQYPEATFILRWADEDDYGYGQGILYAEAGIVTEREIEDKKEFLKILLGYCDDEDEDEDE